MFQHILTDKGLEIFDNDWKKLQEELTNEKEKP